MDQNIIMHIVNQTVISTNAVLSSGTANYSEDVPAIKPERNLIKF
jgi:hypothetical protein